MSSSALAPFKGGPWNGQQRPVTVDKGGRLQNFIRDFGGEAAYKLVYDSAAIGPDGWTYTGVRYEYLPGGESHATSVETWVSPQGAAFSDWDAEFNLACSVLRRQPVETVRAQLQNLARKHDVALDEAWLEQVVQKVADGQRFTLP